MGGRAPLESTTTPGGPPVGLSSAHIPSDNSGGYYEVRSGLYRNVEEGRRDYGPYDIPIKHPTGNGEISCRDWLLTARRWRDGISVGRLPFVEPERTTRGMVREFSQGSRVRMVRFLRESEATYRYMGTLTVGSEFSRDPADFRACVDRFLVAAMRQLKREHVSRGESEDEASIFWWVEFQSRGAPHLHFYYTCFMPWKHLADRWGALCERFNLCAEHEIGQLWRTSTKFEKIRGGFRGYVAYARKYAYKSEQKHEVEGVLEGGWRGRYWGVRGNRRRGSCHVQIHSRQAGSLAFKGLRSWLDRMVEEGVLRRLAWEYGDGAVYWIKDGSQWSEHRFGAELEIRLSRVILEGGLECR